MVILHPILLQRFEDAGNPEIYYIDHRPSVYVTPMDGNEGVDFIGGWDKEWSEHVWLDVIGSV